MPNRFYYHYEHSRLRAYQRYDLRLDKKLFSRFNLAVKTEQKMGRIDVYKIKSLNSGRLLYKIRYKSKNYLIAYCPKEEFIVTFLPETPYELQN